MKDSSEKGLKPRVVGQSTVEKVSGRARSCRGMEEREAPECWDRLTPQVNGCAAASTAS